MQTTANYSLNKPEPNDLFSLEHWNQNADILDDALAPEFEDYETTEVENPVVIPDAQTSLSKIKSKTRFDKLFSHIKAFCKKCLTLEMLVKDCLTDDDNLPLAASQGKHLQNQFDTLYGYATNVISVSVPVSGWSNGAPYTQSIKVTGLHGGLSPFMAYKPIGGNNEDAYTAYSLVNVASIDNDNVTLTCFFERPETDFNIYLRG